MAVLVELTWKKRNGRAPATSDRQEDGFDPVRIVKTEPSPSGPANDDADIRSRILYNEGGPSPVEYHTVHEASDVVAKANVATA